MFDLGTTQPTQLSLDLKTGSNNMAPNPKRREVLVMWRVFLQFVVLAFVFNSIAFDLMAQTSDSPATLRAKLVNVMDHNGFERPLVAFSILVPTTWRPEGGIIWGQGADPCGGMG